MDRTGVSRHRDAASDHKSEGLATPKPRDLRESEHLIQLLREVVHSEGPLPENVALTQPLVDKQDLSPRSSCRGGNFFQSGCIWEVRDRSLPNAMGDSPHVELRRKSTAITLPGSQNSACVPAFPRSGRAGALLR